MAKIIRDPSSAAKENYDLIIIGGGIYGAMLSLESSRRGFRSLLLERDDFGEHTSFNSLRIIHGGLRYLQNLDLPRFFESVGERRWFLQAFPHLVKPLPCLMPLYGNGLRRPFFLRLALWANHLLSYNRNTGVRSDHHIPFGQVIDADETRAIFPSVQLQGLKGGAVWYDGCMPDSQRLLIEILRWACELGATTLNYVEAHHLLTMKGKVVGVVGVDQETGVSQEYRANVVVNACGPWCRNIAERFDRDEPNLFKGSLAWNVLLDREAVSDYAVAVAPEKPGAMTYFLLPWKGRLIAGTGYAPWFGKEKNLIPSSEQLEKFFNDLNLSAPSLEVNRADILRVFSGLLPVTETGSISLTTRPIIFDHAYHGGPRGLFSISGIKFTTARIVAEKTLKRIFPEQNHLGYDRRTTFRPPQDAQNGRGIFDLDVYSNSDLSVWRDFLWSLISEEAVLHLDDLILRRTTLWENPFRAIKIARTIYGLFDWDDYRHSKEIARLKEKFNASCLNNLESGQRINR